MPSIWQRLTGRADDDRDDPPPPPRRGQAGGSGAGDGEEPPFPGALPVPPPDELMDLITRMPPRRVKFCRLYLETGNAYQAALKAGYSKDMANKAGVRLLRREDVRKYIRLAQAEADRAARVSREALVLQLWAIAEGRQPAEATERSQARAVLARLLLARDKVRSADEAGDSRSKPAAGAAGEGGGWDERIADFEREVLGVGLDGDDGAATG